jgi:phage/plasmid-like protein (TIGR03299 family)
MSHEVETMAYSGEVPWHGLGTRVSPDLQPEEMLVEAGLDWTVSKRDLVFQDESDPTILHSTGSKALVRSSDNSVLTIVGENWNPVQNHQAFEFFSDFVLAGDMKMHTAGSLRNGKVVWALAEVNDSFETVAGDRVDSYLLFTNPHEFGRAIDVRFTPIRVVCNNTLSLSLRMKSEFQVRISHRMEFNPDQVKETMKIARVMMEEYNELSTFLASRQTTTETLKKYFGELFPRTSNRKDSADLSRNAQRVLEVVDTQPGAEFAKGSWWQGYNAVSYLIDHELGRDRSNRLYNSWYGPNREKKNAALELAVQYAGGAMT